MTKSPRWLAAAALFILTAAFTLSRGVAADKRPAALEEAAATFQKSREAANKKLAAGFDAARERLGKQKLSPQERLRLLDAIKAERARFDSRGLLPWSEPMWPFLDSYLDTLRISEARITKEYDAHISRALRDKDDAAAAELVADLKKLLAAKVVARWNHSAGGNTGPIDLYSNGKIGGADSKSTWVFERGVLVLRWPNEKAPGGAWIDACRVSADGSMYAGSNQNKTKISGSYRKD